MHASDPASLPQQHRYHHARRVRGNQSRYRNLCKCYLFVSNNTARLTALRHPCPLDFPVVLRVCHSAMCRRRKPPRFGYQAASSSHSYWQNPVHPHQPLQWKYVHWRHLWFLHPVLMKGIIAGAATAAAAVEINWRRVFISF